MRVERIADGSDPGGTPGEIFTGSIGQREIIVAGKVLNYLKIGIKGAVSTAAVVIETFAGLLSEFALKVGSETRIQGNMADLVALQGFLFGEKPLIGENTDATGNDFIGGVKIPVFAPVDPAKPITYTATRTAQTNIATETLGISAYTDDTPNVGKPIHAVTIAVTTAAAAGYQELAARVAPVGKLLGIILMQANDFADGNIDVSVQRLRIKVNGQYHSQFNALTDHTPVVETDVVTPSPYADLTRNYKFFDLRPSGIDAKMSEVVLEWDVEDVSDAIRIIPVLEIA